MPAPSVLLLDVNETLSDLAPMADRFADVGASRELAATWFASVLRDGFALTATATSAPFAAIAGDVARRLLAGCPLDRGVDAAVDHVLAGFGVLDVHPDVAPGLTALHEAGVRVATLSNGAAAVAEGLLDRAGLAPLVERTLSVEDLGVWKPAAVSYRWACDQLGVAPEDVMLVAVHPWDTDGAQRAGLRAAWVDREGRGFPAHFTPPTLQVASFVELAAVLAGQ